MAETEEQKMVLKAADAEALEGTRARVLGEFLNPDQPRRNVVGVATGVKWRNGEPTGKPAVLVLVTHKMDKSELSKEDMIPTKEKDTELDVLAAGFLTTEQVTHAPVASDGALMREEEQLTALADAFSLARRIRPAGGGSSVGHLNITAGTVGTCVYDILPGGATGAQPKHGVGLPPRYYVLSNNHVLADVNAGQVGDAILQPGPFDGGTDPADRIARLTRFVPIALDPPTPRAQHNNLVDAAIAEGEFSDLDREIYWSGYVTGWRRRRDVDVGTVVQKTGRTTNYTTGTITAINATVDVAYPGGGIGRFTDQIILSNMSAGGDSGSLITTRLEVAVGLLFAGSALVTIANQIENVRSLLRVEVAERIA
jgi:hypothetical protein